MALGYVKPSLATYEFSYANIYREGIDIATKCSAGGRFEMLPRNVAISLFRANVRLSASHRWDDEPGIESQPWLELQRRATEPSAAYPT